MFCAVVVGAGCSKQPSNGPDASAGQALLPAPALVQPVVPKIVDRATSPDGKQTVAVSGSNIVVKKSDGTSDSFALPKYCDNDIDGYAWFGKGGDSVLYYVFCGGAMKSAIYRLDATSGKVMEKHEIPDAIGLDGNDISGRFAFDVSAKGDSGLVVMGLDGQNGIVIAKQLRNEDGSGMEFRVTLARFSPSGDKLYYIYTSKGAEKNVNGTFMPDTEWHHSIYDFTSRTNIDADKYFKLAADDEGFYGWTDDSHLVTKNKAGNYHVYEIK